MPPSKRVEAAFGVCARGFDRRSARRRRPKGPRGLAVEALEERLMMSGTEPLPDIAVTRLMWNTLRDMDPFGAWRGVDVTYEVLGQLPPGVDLEIAFSWASGPEPENALGDPIATRRLDPSGGLHTVNDAAFWAPPPAGTSYLLAMADPDDQIEEFDEQNNWAALPVHSAAELLASAISVSRIDPYTIQAEFSPGGGQFTLSEAELVLGVHHFNWIVQSYLPGSMEIQQLAEIGYKILEGHPFLEPATSVSDLAGLRLYSPFGTPNTQPFASQQVDDDLFYWNEPDRYDGPELDLDIRNYQSGGSVFFYSSPRVPDGFYGPGEASSFYLRLMGVSIDGQPIDLGTTDWYTWQSNTVYDPVPGTGVWFASDPDDPLPNPVGGGVTRPEQVSVTSPMARRDSAVAGQQGPVIIDVLANDFDPQGAALRLIQLGPAKHGTVERDDAGTPDDPTDDRVRYTPQPGYAGDDQFQYVVVRRNGGPGLAIGQVTVHVPGPIVGLAALGDSLSDEYVGESYSYAHNWVELLAASGVPMGTWGSYGEPRREGYAYDWARAGATSESLLAQGQVSGVADQAAAGLVNYAVLWVGQNDFFTAWDGIYWYDDPQRAWTSQQIADFTAGVVSNIRSALDVLAGRGVHVVLVNIGDLGTLPAVRQYYPDAQRRELVTQVVAGLNNQLAALAADYRVPLVDMFGLGHAYLGTNAAPLESVTIGGRTFWNAGGSEPTYLFVADGVHPHTVTQAIFANLMLKALELGYGADVASHWRSEEAIVSLAGLPYGGQDTLNLDYAQYVVLPPANRPPLGVEDQYATDEDTALQVAPAAGVLANDHDPDGQELLARLASGAAHGMVVLQPDGSFRYQPEANYHGPDRFTYWLDDGQAAVEVSVQITVQGVNDPPLAVADTYETNEDTPLVVATGQGVLANDSDVDGDPLAAVLASGPSHGQLSLASDGSFVYTPAADYFGPDSFTYRANDGSANSDAVMVTLTVHPVNDPPQAADDWYLVDENAVLVVPAARGLLANDRDAEGTPLSVAIEAPPAHGVLELAPDGSFRYTPAFGFAGSDRFSYRASDGQSSSSVAVVSIRVARLLGQVDFRQLDGISLEGGEAWYRVETTRAGWLTAETTVSGSPEDSKIALYDAGQNLLHTSTLLEGKQRLDQEVSAGQTYYVRIFGISPQADLRLVNLVRKTGATVTVAGTGQSDPFVFDAARLRLSIHGVSYAFAPLSISNIQFDGGAGDDSAVLLGTTQPEVATLAPGSATLVGPTWSASVANTAAIVVFGQGGEDQATFYAAPAARDTFTASPHQAAMAGAGYANRAVGFGQITGFATPGAEDVAVLFGSSSDDQFDAEAGNARLTDNRSYRITARDFLHVQAWGGAGIDSAALRGTVGDEVFTARPGQTALRGSALWLQTSGFEQVTAEGGGGNDTAWLYGSPGDDLFEAHPAEAWSMLTTSTSTTRTGGFRYVYAVSDGQGADQARLDDSADSDTLIAQPGYTILAWPGGLVRAEGFASVSAASSHGGEDQAALRDSSGDDTLQAWLTAVTLAGPGYFLSVEGFGRVSALSSSGNDSATFFYPSADAVFVGTWQSARLASDGAEVVANQFRDVTVHGLTGEGWDRAYLYDGPGDDTLVAADSSVALNYPDRVIRLLDLSWVRAHSINGGMDRRRVEAIDFVLSTAGPWEDI